MRTLVLLLPVLGACGTTSQTTGSEPVPEPVPGPPTIATMVDDDTPAIEAMIDDWHDAAAKADEARYLGHFTEDAVFLGTDATERWNLAQFTEYVETYFPDGGWTYHSHHRHVLLGATGDLAWFDEQLTNEGYGELRGTGVARKVDGTWRLAHYSMTFTVPNDVAREVVDRIKAWGASR
jgi:uncharacterized protein (TIGR02246 family)